MLNHKRFLLILAGLTLLGLVILAAGISTLDLNSGPIYLIPDSGHSTPTVAPTQAARIPDNYLNLLLLVFLIILPVSLLYLFISPEARRRFLIQLVQVGSIVFFVYFLSKNITKFFPGLGERLSGNSRDDLAGGRFEIRFLEPFQPQSPLWLTELLSLVLAAGFIYILFFLWRRLRRAGEGDLSPTEKLVRSAQSAIKRIDAGQNLREVVLRCYHEMTQAVAEKRQVTRPEYLTPHEFINHLEEIGLPGEQVGRLTALFESVRYGHKIPGSLERAEAMACLEAIVAQLGGES